MSAEKRRRQKNRRRRQWSFLFCRHHGHDSHDLMCLTCGSVLEADDE